MKRVAFISVVVFGLACAPRAFAQTPKATATASTPATVAAPAPPAVIKARMATPVKGTAYIEVIAEQAKQVGKEIVQKLKVRNVSNAPIAGLRVDQYWYSKAGEQVTGDTQRVRFPIAPGEIIDVELKSPAKGDVLNNRTMFAHANGKVDAKGVKKFTPEKETKK
jgi:hypothetical protein